MNEQLSQPTNAIVDDFRNQMDLLSQRNYDLRMENASLIAIEAKLRSALGSMLTFFGMDEDEWNNSIFDQSRKALEIEPNPRVYQNRAFIQERAQLETEWVELQKMKAHYKCWYLSTRGRE